MSGAESPLLRMLAAPRRMLLPRQEFPSSSASGARGVSRGIWVCVSLAHWSCFSLSPAPFPAPAPPGTPELLVWWCSQAAAASLTQQGRPPVPWASAPSLNPFLTTRTRQRAHEKWQRRQCSQELTVPGLERACPAPNPGPATFYLCNCDQVISFLPASVSLSVKWGQWWE